MRGKWICTEQKVQTPLFVKKFNLHNAKTVKIDISGLGYFVLLVNGKRISTPFVPAQTDYMKRDTSIFTYPIFDTFTHKVFYLNYDITKYVHEGENEINVIVGNGWFRQPYRIAEGHTSYSDLVCTAFDINISDELGHRTVSSDGSELAFVYPILESNLFTGETVDTRMFLKELPRAETMLFDDTLLGELVLQECPFDRVIRTIKPKHIGGGMFDLGENISGRVYIKGKGESGNIIKVVHAEEIKDDDLFLVTTGANSTGSNGQLQIQADTYILNGETVELYPEFVFHGFRYFKIEGEIEIEELRAEVIHTDLPQTASFTCDNEIINWTYDAFIRGYLGNMHGCVPSDCPHRERLGYTGDGQIVSMSGMLTFDSKLAYKKWIEDIFECQCKVSGHVQHSAPFMGGGGGPGGWGSAIVFVPYNYYNVYGDSEMLKIAYPKMLEWLKYMQAHCENGLLVREEEGGWCLGEWLAPPTTEIDQHFVNTCCMVKSILIMADIADTLGLDDGEMLRTTAKTHKKALYDNYYKNGSYLDGLQGADALALWAELLGDGIEESLIKHYEERSTFDTGFIGTEILCNMLFSVGRGDLAIKLIGSDDTEIGFNAMRLNNATTLYEHLCVNEESHNHPAFAGCLHTLYTGLMGIKLSGGKAVIMPCIDSGLREFSGSVKLESGKVAVSLKGNVFTIYTETPTQVIIKGESFVTQEGTNTYYI